MLYAILSLVGSVWAFMMYMMVTEIIMAVLGYHHFGVNEIWAPLIAFFGSREQKCRLKAISVAREKKLYRQIPPGS